MLEFHSRQEAKNLLFAKRYGATSQTLEQFYRRQMMYEQFANLSRRIAGAENDVEIAAREHTALVQKRDNLVIKHVDNIEIGTHPVPGGKVVVTSLTPGSNVSISYYPVDENTQLFARFYAGCCHTMRDWEYKARVANEARDTCERARDARLLALAAQLVDGDYIVADGFVRIHCGEAIFHANT